MRRYISSIIGLSIFFLFFAVATHAASCTFDGQSLSVGQSYCGGGNTLYTCVSDNNVSPSKCPAGQECQYTDTRRTFAVCGFPATECKDSAYRLYSEGQSWCSGQEIYTCQGGKAVKTETCGIKDGLFEKCYVTDSVKRIAGCKSREAPGCIDSLNQYHLPNTTFCATDNSSINVCDGSRVVAKTQCDNQSCVESSSSQANCLSEGKPVEGDLNYLEKFEEQNKCGNLGQKCCGPSTIPPLEVPKPGMIGFDQVIEQVNKAFGLVNNTLVKLYNKYIETVNGGQLCKEGVPSDNTKLANCMCRVPAFGVGVLCNNISTLKEQESCMKCAGANGIWTAFGCIEYSFGKFVQDVLFGFGLRFAMAITFFCIIYGALQLQLSRGDAARIKKAQELITSCISGLMLIIFSIFILRVIGVDLLRIPGFGSTGGDVNTKAVCIQNQNKCFLNKESKCYSTQEFMILCVGRDKGDFNLAVSAKLIRLPDGSCDQRGVSYQNGPNITPAHTRIDRGCQIRMDY